MKKILVLGTGCPKCEKLLEHTNQAVEQAGLSCDIEKVTDIQRIVSFGVMMTPALVIDNKVVVSGRVPDVTEIMKMLQA
ncbi:MAG TPA: thioredoxin family protein [candidate division Zixibacteria bacterium]|nr:thioredoxin family protein [candidate division Zixibacteria bacterium]